MVAPVFVGSKFVIDEKTSHVSRVEMAALPDNGFIAIWRGAGGDMRLQKFNSDGTERTAEAGVPLSTDSTNERFDVTILSDGGYVVTWERYIGGTGAVVEGAVFNGDGSLRKSTFQVNKAPYTYFRTPDIVALSNGGFMVVYEGPGSVINDAANIYGRTFSKDGTLVKDEFLVSSTTAGTQERPVVTALENGTVATSYKSGNELRIRLLQADGSPVPNTSEILVGSCAASLKPVSITTLSNGRFVVVWAAPSGDGSGSNILAQVFEEDGRSYGDRITVNTTTIGTQDRPQITALPDGGFAVVFEDFSRGLNDPDVRVATFGATGNRYGDSDLIVHNSTNGQQTTPDIITLADGHLVVSWRDADGSLVGQVFQQDMIVNGTAGADVLRGGPGNDVMNGLDDFDRLFGSAGADHLKGGDGFDVADYSNAKAAVIIDLVSLGNASGDAAGDTYDGIESWFGSGFNDTITVNDQARELWGAGGNDLIRAGAGGSYLDGGSGNDTLEGGAEGDVLIGGAGFDIISYADSNAAVTVSLTGTATASGGHAAGDTFVSNGNPSLSVEGIIGSAFEDTLTGHATIGSYLNGGYEKDKLKGGSGNDTLIGGDSGDIMEGGGGTDTAVFSGTRSRYTITRNDDGSMTVEGLDGEDVLKDIRFLKFDDKVEALTNVAPTGLSLSNTVTVENAPLGAEVGRLAATDADGDALTYSLAPGSSSAFGIRTVNGVTSLVVTGSLDFETQATHQVTIQARDDYSGVTSKTVTLTVANAIETTPFTVLGTGRADTLTGESGHDTIYGSSGNDQIYGALGNDRLHGGTGNDRLWGHGGRDTFVFDTRLNKSTNVDKIYDFRSADDSFYMDNKYFTKLGSGSLSKPKKFKSDMFVESNKARDAEDRIVYDRKTGALYYDQDGTGSKAQVKIATITPKTKLYYHDFFVI